jgi:hypothetical protein
MWYPWSRHWTVSWIPLIGTAGRLPDMATSEPLVNGRLYHLLTSGVWRSSRGDAAKPDGHEPRSFEVQACSAPGGKTVPGTLYVEIVDGGEMGRRALFVPSGSMADEREVELALYPASFSVADGRVSDCRMSFEKALGIPLRLRPRVLLDARLQYLAAALSDRTASVTLYEFDWRRLRPAAEGQPASRLDWAVNWVSADALALATFDKEFGTSEARTQAKSRLVRPVPTWREPGGYGFVAGGSSWRILKRGFERIPGSDTSSGAWQPLAGEGAATHCEPWREVVEKEAEEASRAADARAAMAPEAHQPRAQPVFHSVFYGLEDRCIEVKRGSDSTTGPDEERILVALHDQLNHSVVARIGKPPAVASLVAYQSRPKTMESPRGEQWVVGKPGGAYDGWIGLQWQDGGKTVVEGAPLTTEALLRLAESFCKLGVDAASRERYPVPKEAELCRSSKLDEKPRRSTQ